MEVQRLQVKIQEAEARASASQRIAEEAQREMQALVAASNSPVAGQARQAIDAEKAILRQQLMVLRPSALAFSLSSACCPHKMGGLLTCMSTSATLSLQGPLGPLASDNTPSRVPLSHGC